MKLDVYDFVGVAGLGLLSYGAWLIYEPAAFIVAGALMIACAVASARK